MSDENKEKIIPETPEDEKEKVEGDWKWDAAVPETKTDDITLDDLAPIMDKEEAPAEEEKAQEEPAEEAEEAPAEEEKKEEKKEEKNETEEKAEKKADGKCVICGNSTKNSPNDLYCEDCARKFLRTHFGIPQVVLAFVMVFFAAFSWFVCVSTVDFSAQLMKAENLFSEKRYTEAIGTVEDFSADVATVDQGFNATLATFNKNQNVVDFFVDGERSMRILLDAYADSLPFSQEQIAQFVNLVSVEVDKDKLETRKYEKIKKMYDYCVEVNSYSNEIGPTWYTFMYTDEKTSEQKIKYDEAIAFLETCPNDTPAQKSLNGYYRYIAAYFAEKDKEVVFEIFDNLYEDLGEYSYLFDLIYLQVAWTYEDYDRVEVIAERLYESNLNATDAYYYSIKANILQGDFTKADELCERIHKDSPESLDYYSFKAEVLRRMGKYQESIDICKKGIAVEANASIYNQQAISCMLLDDKEGALDAAKTAYEIITVSTQSQASYEILNTIALIGKLCDDTETYEEVKALFENTQEPTELDEKVKKCIEGEITFEEIFMEGYGDI